MEQIKYQLALVEDEKNLASLVIKYLQTEGYEVDWYQDGEQALKAVQKEYALWILDIMLPGITSGYDLIKSIRKEYPQAPIIFTSARDQDIDKIMGLELGSDDYLAKPYSIRVPCLRVKNFLARSYEYHNDRSHHKNILSLGDYLVDKERRCVSCNGQNLSLTSKEYDLLLYLLEHPGKAFSRDQILTTVWGDDYFGSDRVVDDLMRRLRQKMPNLSVETIYGYGYRLLV